MNPQRPEQGPDLPEVGESRSDLDPDSLTHSLAEKAEALIPKEGDAASALEKVSEALHEGSAPENLDRALKALEQQNEWSQATRELAFEISFLEQREHGETPMTFDEAVGKLEGLGDSRVDALITDLQDLDDQGRVKAVGGLLEVVEGLMAAGQLEADKTKVRELRAIRNALFLEQEEINIRIEKAEADALEAFEGEEEEDEAQAKVRDAYKKIKSPGSNESMHGQDDGLDEQALLDKLDPYDLQDLMWYESQNFRLDQRTREQVPYLKAFVTKRLQMASKEIPVGGRTGSVSDIMGDKGEALDFLRLVSSTKRNGQMIAPNVFSKMSFTDAARSIGLDVYKYVPDYDKRFAVSR